MIKECIYAQKCLIESGINFKRIPKENIMVTCKEYDGIIAEKNYAAIISAIDEIYKEVIGY